MNETALRIGIDGTESLVREIRYLRADLRRLGDDMREWSSCFCTAVATFENAIDDSENLLDAPAPIGVLAQTTAPAATIAQAQPVTPAAAPAPAPAAVQTPQVPTAPVAYTLDHLTEAAAKLMDEGGDAARAQLQKIVSELGCRGLYELPKERFGDFAAKLRAIGGKI